jgi:hypothetical protein
MGMPAGDGISPLPYPPFLQPQSNLFLLNRLFIIDGIITLPLALLGYIFFPNLPQGDKKTWWTTDAEHEISKERMKVIGRAGKQPWTKAKAKRILFSWHTYLLRMFPTSLSPYDQKPFKTDQETPI